MSEAEITYYTMVFVVGSIPAVLLLFLIFGEYKI